MERFLGMACQIYEELWLSNRIELINTFDFDINDILPHLFPLKLFTVTL